MTMNYKALRDLVLVKKLGAEKELSGGIILPDKVENKFIKLEVLDKGDLVIMDIEKGDIVLAEDMFEVIDKKTNVGLIVSKYIAVKEYGRTTN